MTSRFLLMYLIAFSVMEAAVITFSVFGPEHEIVDRGFWFRAFSGLLLTAIGVYYVYRRNGGASGRWLLERFLVLGWVTAIHFALLTAVVMFGWVLLSSAGSLPDLPDPIGELVFALGVPVYYAYLGHHVGGLAREDAAA